MTECRILPLWVTCEDCSDHLNWHVVGALASVGIEHGMSTYEMATTYISNYHENDHRTTREEL